MPRVVYVAPSTCTVTASPLTIANDGTTPSYITVRCLDSRGNAMAGLAAANVVIAVSGSGNTVTQPTGVTNADGRITGSFVSSLGETKTASATVLGTAVTDTASVTVSNDLLAFGAGPNAPTWTSQVDYTAQTFDSPIPPNAGSADAAGWYFLDGDSTDPALYNPINNTYPTVVTPIGTRTVLKSTYPGQREVLGALEDATTPYPAWNNAYVRIQGTFVGTMTFEISDDDGDTWSAASLTVRAGAGATGTTASVEGTWGGFPTAIGRTARVRMSSYTSGSATVDVGHGGSGSSIRAVGGSFDAGHTRWYHRHLIYISPTFDNNDNVGVKLGFFAQPQQGHYFDLTQDGFEQVSVTRQGSFGTTNTITAAVNTLPRGQWLDVEYVFISNTADNSDGTLQVWVDNVQVLNRTDIKYFPAANDHEWTYLQIASTFGGGFRPSFSTADTWFYMSGAFHRTAP